MRTGDYTQQQIVSQCDVMPTSSPEQGRHPKYHTQKTVKDKTGAYRTSPEKSRKKSPKQQPTGGNSKDVRPFQEVGPPISADEP